MGGTGAMGGSAGSGGTSGGTGGSAGTSGGTGSTTGGTGGTTGGTGGTGGTTGGTGGTTGGTAARRSGLAGGGDQVFAYQGDASSPSFLYGFSCATAAGAGFVATGTGSSNNESELPAVLDGTTKYFVEVDSSGFNGCEYSGSRTSLSKFLGYITLLNVPGNYAEAPSSSMFDLTGDVFTTP